jgi:hypothetical protein
MTTIHTQITPESVINTIGTILNVWTDGTKKMTLVPNGYCYFKLLNNPQKTKKDLHQGMT